MHLSWTASCEPSSIWRNEFDSKFESNLKMHWGYYKAWFQDKMTNYINPVTGGDDYKRPFLRLIQIKYEVRTSFEIYEK